MNPSLSSCPFCGKTPWIENRDVEPQGDSWYGKKMEDFVLCECGACLFDGSFHEGFYDPDTRAVAAWNRRASLWRPIDKNDHATLPPFDQPVWLSDGKQVWIGGRSDDADGWLWTQAVGLPYIHNGEWKCDMEFEDLNPTHWQPLPPPPEGGEGK